MSSTRQIQILEEVRKVGRWLDRLMGTHAQLLLQLPIGINRLFKVIGLPKVFGYESRTLKIRLRKASRSARSLTVLKSGGMPT